MPIYEYECCKCNEVTETLQKFSEPPLKKCPKCGGKVSKMMSRNAFHLKGGGWYVTDYKGKNSSTAPPTEAKENKGDTPAKKEKKTSKAKDSTD